MDDNNLTASRHLRLPRRWGAPLVAGTFALFAATPALAYVGPGAGLSLLGALWGVIAAVVLALAFVVIWPVRRLIKRRAGPAAAPAATHRTGDRTTTS